MVSDDEDLDCPLCMEEFDIADRNFRPCPCGYQICRFCWHHIKSNLNGRCPACRRTYTDQIVQFIPVSTDEIVKFQKEKKEKERQHKDVKDSSRRHLSSVRVVQKNLVYILGLSSKHASAENELFNKHGKIAKLVVSKRTTTASSGGGQSSSVGIYVTYYRKEDAAKAIAGINGATYDGRSLRASYGTTKYCTYYLRHMGCPNPNCMYLHEPGEDVDSYTKDSVGKPHPSGSSTTTTITATQSTVPSKRSASAATARSATRGESSSSSSQMAVEPASPPKKSAWAPIPKIVPPPPPPPPPPAPVVEQQQQQPSPTVAETRTRSEAAEAAAAAAAAVEPSETAAPSPKQRKQTHHAPEPAKSTSEKVTKPIAIEKKPALPATAAWGKGPATSSGTTTSSVASSLDNNTTPVNFGPSLSDALSASQKPKHSPTIPRKKEKKLKSKMVRLEDFEESMRTGGKPTTPAAAASPAAITAKGKASAAAPPAGGSALSAQLRRGNGESAWQPVPKPPPAVVSVVATKPAEPKLAPQKQKQPKNKQPAKAKEPAVVKPEKMDVEKPAPAPPTKDEDMPMAEPAQEKPKQQQQQQQPIVAEEKDQHAVCEEEKGRSEEEEQQQQEHLEEEMAVPLQKPEARSDLEQEDRIVDAMAGKESSPEFTVQVQPSFTSYVLGNLMGDDVHDGDLDSIDDEGGLSSLKADMASEDDSDSRLYEHMSRADAARSEKVQEDELGGASARLEPSTLQESIERFEEQPQHVHFHPVQQHQQGPSPTLLDEFRMPLEQQQQYANGGSSGVRAHGPPPGFNGPPEWQSHNFDPFNGQDPAAARRLQHSQQMLEASGLFPGFARPPPPPPPSLFDFHHHHHHHGNTPPPPPGMFGMPPQPMLRQPPPPHRPDFVNMPPGLGPMGPPPPPPPQQQQQQQQQHSPMDSSHHRLQHEMMHLESSMRRLSMQHQQHPSETREDPMRSMQDDLRALLPNVNISFSSMRDEDQSRNKPHTPDIEDPYRRRPSDLSSNTPVLLHEHEPQNDKILATLTNGSAVHKPDAYPEEIEESSPVPPPPQQQQQQQQQQDGNQPDVKQEAQNFFGEFLRKAAASTPHDEQPHKDEPGSMPFQDPAIMSVRMSNGSPAPPLPLPMADRSKDMTESQNAILQILGAHPAAGPPEQHPRFPTMMERPPLSTPPAQQDMMSKPPFDMFLSPQQQQQQHHQQHPMPPPPHMPFHHHRHPPPPQQQEQHRQPPPPFMSGSFGGSGDMPMGMMPPPPHHPLHHPPHPFGHQQQDGMMPPGGPPPPHPHPPHHPPPPHHHHPHGPPPPLAALMELKFRQQQHRNGNLPPGLFPGGEGL